MILNPVICTIISASKCPTEDFENGPYNHRRILPFSTLEKWITVCFMNIQQGVVVYLYPGNDYTGNGGAGW